MRVFGVLEQPRRVRYLSITGAGRDRQSFDIRRHGDHVYIHHHANRGDCGPDYAHSACAERKGRGACRYCRGRRYATNPGDASGPGCAREGDLDARHAVHHTLRRVEFRYWRGAGARKRDPATRAGRTNGACTASCWRAARTSGNAGAGSRRRISTSGISRHSLPVSRILSDRSSSRCTACGEIAIYLGPSSPTASSDLPAPFPKAGYLVHSRRTMRRCLVLHPVRFT